MHYYVCRTGWPCYDPKEILLTDGHQREWHVLEVANQEEALTIVIEYTKELLATKSGGSVMFKTATDVNELLTFLNL